MKNRFNVKVAKEIANRSFGHVLDSILGKCDPDYGLETPIGEFEQNFTEDLEEKNIIVTPKRIEIINIQYLKKLKKVISFLEKQY